MSLVEQTLFEAITLTGGRKFLPRELFVKRISAYVVCIEDGKVLLVPHKEALTLGFPGGEVDPMEFFAQCLPRECSEEIGTGSIVVGPVIDTAENYFYYEGTDAAFDVKMIFFLGRVIHPELIHDTGDKYEGPPDWYTIADLRREQFPQLHVNNYLNVIKRAQKFGKLLWPEPLI